MAREAAAEVSPLSLCFAGKRVVTSDFEGVAGLLPAGPALIGIEGSVFDRVRLAVALSKMTGIPCLATEQFVEAHELGIFAEAFGQEPGFDIEAFRRAATPRPLIVAGTLLLSTLDRVNLVPDFLIYVVRADSTGVPTGLGDILADRAPDLLRSLCERRPADLPLGLFSLDPNQFAPARRPYHASRKPVTSADVVFVETRWNLEHVPANARQGRGDEAVARLTLTRRGKRNLALKEARDTAERMWREGGDNGAVAWLGIAAVIEEIAEGEA